MAGAAPAQTLQQIASLARGRRLDEAALLVARTRLEHGDDPVLAALGGAIEFHRGKFAQAIPLLQAAHEARPDDLVVRGNLAECLARTGQDSAALALCSAAAVEADTSLRLARLGAGLAQQSEDYERAAELYQSVVARAADDWSSWNNLGNALTALGSYDKAVAALQRAAELAPDSQPIRVNLGNALLDAGRWDEAETVLRRAADESPGDANPLLSLYRLFRDQGRDDDAFDAIAEAAGRVPSDAAVQSDYGQEAARRNEYGVAETAYEAALAIDPALGPAFVGLATVYERMNREAQLGPLRTRAIAVNLESPSLALIDALIAKREGDFDTAFAALEQAGDVIVPGRKHHLRGIMLDRLGNTDEAFEAFAEMNRHWAADPSQPRERARHYREAVAHSHALLTPDWIAGWSQEKPADPRPAPIFLVGFPRSGTTLLDTMLMADPKVVVLEEEPFIGQLELELGGIDAFPGLDAAAIARARDQYFAWVAGIAPIAPETVIVDKHPMHLNKVPAIKRFFPDARFVLALRHPCDALLSCFITNFRINNAMANFLDLGDAAALYDSTFAHWERAREVFGLPVGTVVYERLVEDKTRELRPLFDWLGLDWPGDEHDHREAARARGLVTTASYSQVTEPLYKRAAGRWHKYIRHLEPVLPVLRPWVERFGYSLEDGRIPPWPDAA